MADDLADCLALVITPTLAKKIATLESVRENKEVRKSGMYLFMSNQHSVAWNHQATEVAGLNDFITS